MYLIDLFLHKSTFVKLTLGMKRKANKKTKHKTTQRNAKSVKRSIKNVHNFSYFISIMP